jgi:hypothetical protein
MKKFSKKKVKPIILAIDSAMPKFAASMASNNVKAGSHFSVFLKKWTMQTGGFF